MELEQLLKYRAVNLRLPHFSYFCFEGKEITDFVLKPKPGIELIGGKLHPMCILDPSKVTLSFDNGASHS